MAGNTDHYVKYAIQAQDNGNMTPYLQYVGLREGQTWSTLDNIENSSQHNADDLWLAVWYKYSIMSMWATNDISELFQENKM